MNQAKTIVVIPTYNEANNLPVLVAELWALQIPGLSVLVVDDSSPDGTGEVGEELARQRPGDLDVLHQAERKGLGPAYVVGFKSALSRGADHVIQMDSDFSHAPKHVPEMLHLIREADVVVGSRYVAGGKLDERWSAGQYLLSWWANVIYARMILNLKVKDATSGFKCWRAAALREIDLDAVSSNGYSFQFEMAYVAEKLGHRIIEIPIYFEDRRSGRSKLTVPSKVEAALRPWEILWRYRKLEPSTPSPDAAIPRQDA